MLDRKIDNFSPKYIFRVFLVDGLVCIVVVLFYRVCLVKVDFSFRKIYVLGL